MRAPWSGTCFGISVGSFVLKHTTPTGHTPPARAHPPDTPGRTRRDPAAPPPLDHKPRETIGRQPLQQRRRHQEHLLTITIQKVLRHTRDSITHAGQTPLCDTLTQSEHPGRRQRARCTGPGRDSPPHLSPCLLRAAPQVFARWTIRRVPRLDAGGGARVRLRDCGRIGRSADRPCRPAPGPRSRNHTFGHGASPNCVGNRSLRNCPTGSSGSCWLSPMTAPFRLERSQVWHRDRCSQPAAGLPFGLGRDAHQNCGCGLPMRRQGSSAGQLAHPRVEGRRVVAGRMARLWSDRGAADVASGDRRDLVVRSLGRRSGEVSEEVSSRRVCRPGAALGGVGREPTAVELPGACDRVTDP